MNLVAAPVDKTVVVSVTRFPGLCNSIWFDPIRIPIPRLIFSAKANFSHE
jgi:hypothetical protein